MSVKDRGFASMTRERQREIASLGGQAAQASGKGYRWTKEAAAAAGRKGQAARQSKRSRD